VVCSVNSLSCVGIICTEEFFLEVKRPERETNHFLLYFVEIKNNINLRGMEHRNRNRCYTFRTQLTFVTNNISLHALPDIVFQARQMKIVIILLTAIEY
jgi:hypothetical protein